MDYPKHMKNSKENHLYRFERGNVLFLILIAVVLFAGLSYAVTQSSRGGGSTNKETSKINAALVIQYGTILKNAVNRVSLINGCSTEELNFDGLDGTNLLPGTNPNSPADGSCHIFDINGGNVVINTFGGSINPHHFVFGDINFQGVGTTCDAASCSELYYLIRLYSVYESSNPFTEAEAIQLCEQINENLIGTKSIPNISDLTNTNWAGIYDYSATKTHPNLDGHSEFCAYESAINPIISYVKILVEQ